MVERGALVEAQRRPSAVMTFAPPGWQAKRSTASRATPMRARIPSTAAPTCSSAKRGIERSKMTPNPVGVDFPAHDVETVGPQIARPRLRCAPGRSRPCARHRPRRRRRTRRLPPIWHLSAGPCGTPRCRSRAGGGQQVLWGRARAKRLRDGKARVPRRRIPVRTPGTHRHRHGSPCDPPPVPRGWVWRCRSRTRSGRWWSSVHGLRSPRGRPAREVAAATNNSWAPSR